MDIYELHMIKLVIFWFVVCVGGLGLRVYLHRTLRDDVTWHEKQW